MKRPKPKSDRNSPKKVAHDFPQSWYGEVYCMRCNRPLSEIENRPDLPCVTDEQIAAGQTMARLKRRGVLL